MSYKSKEDKCYGKNKNLKEIIKSLISFSFPLILSGVLQQLYNWVDAFIFGNVNGEISLAAIGSITTPINFFITIITGFTLGLSVLIAKNFFLRIACFYPVYDLAIAFRSYLEGKDDLLYSSMAGVAALVIRIISSYAMTSFYGNMVIAYAEMFSWVCLFIMYLLRLGKIFLRKNEMEELYMVYKPD